jgi:ABC-type multidrug transport system fused ATPase/permease subunit
VLSNISLIKTYHLILRTIPLGLKHLFHYSLFFGVIRSIIDLLGIALIIPVIQILIQPAIVEENSILNRLYKLYPFKNEQEFALALMMIVFFVFIFKTVLSYFLAQAQAHHSYKITEEISLARFTSYLHMPYSYYLEQNSSILMRNFLMLPFEFGQRVLIPFIQLVNELLVVSLIFIAMILYQPMLFLAVLILLFPFVALYQIYLRRHMKNISASKDSSSKELFKHSTQAMNVFREIILFKKFNYFKKKFYSGLHDLASLNARINTINEFSPKVVEMIAVTGITLIFLFAWLVNKGNTELVQFLVVFVLVTSRLLPSSNRILLFSTTIRSNEFVFEYLKDIIPFKKSRDIEDKQSPPLIFNDKIEIKDLSFQYDSSDHQLFNNLSINIRKGETIGIIGSSGSGKTTLLHILLRLFNESSGSVLVDSIKVDETNKDRWYRTIGFVPQNINIIDGNFIDNIAFGIDEENVDFKKINAVIKKSELSDLINSSQNGLHTHIGESGLKISGGQRQRIGIARALYTDAQILIFDEATSSLDTQTEVQITEQIKSLSDKNLTIIIVAHRLQTLKYCNSIYKLENGKMSERFSYNQIQNG